MDRYWKKTFLLGRILGEGPNAWLRFSVILLAWLMVLAVISSYENALLLNGKSEIGFFQDFALFGWCLSVLAGIAVLIRCLRNLDRLFETLPLLVKNENNSNQFHLTEDIREAKGFISLESKVSKIIYRVFLLLFMILVFYFQLYIPLYTSPIPKSWAIWPDKYGTLYLAAIAWCLFYWVIVAANLFWLTFSIVYKVFFGMLRRYAQSSNVHMEVLECGPYDNIRVIGRLAV